MLAAKKGVNLTVENNTGYYRFPPVYSIAQFASFDDGRLGVREFYPDLSSSSASV